MRLSRNYRPEYASEQVIVIPNHLKPKEIHQPQGGVRLGKLEPLTARHVVFDTRTVRSVIEPARVSELLGNPAGGRTRPLC